MSQTGYLDPASEEYRCRNPLALKAYSGKHEHNGSGLRVFKNLQAGYIAGIFDLKVKCTGNSRAKVDKDSTLKELLRCYSRPNDTALEIAEFLKKALNDDAISADTQLSYFAENGDA
jgi:hypothetical protein